MGTKRGTRSWLLGVKQLWLDQCLWPKSNQVLASHLTIVGRWLKIHHTIRSQHAGAGATEASAAAAARVVNRSPPTATAFLQLRSS